MSAKNFIRNGIRMYACLLLVMSCTPVRYVGIETYNPAGITFPGHVKKVLIVNNAAAQQEVPFASTVRHLPDSVRISADSAIVEFCRTLGRQIAESPHFEDVRLYEGCYRTDQYASFDVKLTESNVRQLCEDHEVDAVISLDRLLFHINERADNTGLGIDIFNDTQVEVSGVLRACLEGRDAPLSTIYLSDTISLDLVSGDAFWAMITLPKPEQMLNEAATRMALGLHVNFVPYWSADTRWYYASSDSRWKEASAYAVAEKWEKASKVWKSTYAGAGSWKTRARLASNLALCAELSGELTQALQWAKFSHQHFSEHASADDKTVHLQKQYVNILERRIEAEKTLRLQISGMKNEK